MAMNDAVKLAEYFRQAREARASAARAPEAELREAFLKLAEGWERLAESAKRSAPKR
jgi:hypothetical protein